MFEHIADGTARLQHLELDRIGAGAGEVQERGKEMVGLGAPELERDDGIHDLPLFGGGDKFMRKWQEARKALGLGLRGAQQGDAHG